jgi:hypothetical protein
MKSMVNTDISQMLLEISTAERRGAEASPLEGPSSVVSV